MLHKDQYARCNGCTKTFLSCYCFQEAYNKSQKDVHRNCYNRMQFVIRTVKWQCATRIQKKERSFSTGMITILEKRCHLSWPSQNRRIFIILTRQKELSGTRKQNKKSAKRCKRERQNDSLVRAHRTVIRQQRLIKWKWMFLIN